MTSSPVADLEVHLPISPTPVFFTRIHYLAASFQVYGGRLKDSPIVVTVGADQQPEDLYTKLPWSRSYPIEWRWMERELFLEYSYFATRLKRFTHDFKARNVLMLDADVLLVGAIDDLVEHITRTGAFGGSPAHLSPVRGEFTWEKLFQAAGLGAVPYACEHTGFGLMYHDPAHRFCPAYFNLGVLIAPQQQMRKIGTTIFAELDTVRQLEDLFRAQQSVTLALHRHRIPWEVIPLKYNFPNDQPFVARYPDDFADMRLLHFLRKGSIDKDVAFETPDAVYWLFQKEGLDEVNIEFLNRLRPVHDHVLATATSR